MSGRPATRLPFVARCVLRAYPLWWRERYGDDQEMFLEDIAAEGRPLLRAVTDLAVSALRVRLRPAGMPHTAPAWRDRARASIAWATLPALAGLWLTDVIMSHSFRNSIEAGSLTPLSPEGRIAADAMSILNLAGPALLLLLLVGWGLVACLADRAPRGRAGRKWLFLVVAPLLVAGTEIGLNLLRKTLVSGHGQSHHPLAVTVLSVCVDLVWGVGLTSVLGVVYAARRANLQPRDLRGGVWLAQLTAIVLLVAAAAAVAWGIGVSHQPAIPRGDLTGSVAVLDPWTGIQTSIVAEWPFISAGLAAISLVTGWAALTARRSYKVARSILTLGG